MNCDKSHKLCEAQGIKSFPKFLLFSPRYEWSEEYPKDRLKELGKPKDAMGDDIVEWVRLVLPPFTPGFAHMLGGGSAEPATAGWNLFSGRDQLLEWRGPWLLLCVASHDPVRCHRCEPKLRCSTESMQAISLLDCALLWHSCNDAKPNILRLAGELAAVEGDWNAAGAHDSERAVARMRVGIVDCTNTVMGELCRELGPSVCLTKLFQFVLFYRPCEPMRPSLWQGIASTGFPHYALVPGAMETYAGAEDAGADKRKTDAVEEAAARMRLARTVVDIFDPDELPAHLVRSVLLLLFVSFWPQML